MKVFLFLMASLITTHSYSMGCFEEHMRKAIARNEHRKTFAGNEDFSPKIRRRIKFIANSLLIGEHISLATAKKFDQRAKYFQDQGLTVLCDELIDINKMREPLHFKLPEAGQPAEFISAYDSQFVKQIRASAKAYDFKAVETVVQGRLDELVARPSYNCLMRNDLRTILFISQRAPHHLQMAKERGIESPEGILSDLILKMSTALVTINFYDKIAFDLQKQGIPYICQDFPGMQPE